MSDLLSEDDKENQNTKILEEAQKVPEKVKLQIINDAIQQSDLLEGELLPDDKQEGAQQILISQRSHSGPLPDPQDLEQYNNVLPGAAERIVAMAEKEQAHRHKITNESNDATVSSMAASDQRKERGQLYGRQMIVFFAALGAALMGGGGFFDSDIMQGTGSLVLVGEASLIGALFVTNQYHGKKKSRDPLQQDDSPSKDPPPDS